MIGSMSPAEIAARLKKDGFFSVVLVTGKQVEGVCVMKRFFASRKRRITKVELGPEKDYYLKRNLRRNNSPWFLASKKIHQRSDSKGVRVSRLEEYNLFT